MRVKNTRIKINSNMSNKLKYAYAVGRRKQSVARVRLYEGKGKTIVNDKPAEEYFSGEVAQASLLEPLRVTNNVGKFYATVKVVGGGKNGQLDAIVHGLARALVQKDSEKYRSILKKKGFLTRDARVKERRKYGHAHKARAKKQSPKR